MSQGSFDSLNVQKGSIETETKSVYDKPFIRLKPNARPGVIPSNVIKDMQHYSHHQNRDSVQLGTYCLNIQNVLTGKTLVSLTF